jgi:MOSC domain-containing protein YiiM
LTEPRVLAALQMVSYRRPMNISVVSVNIGSARAVPGKRYKSGIFKEPVLVPVAVGAYGLESDAIVDTEHHGGLDQAVYCYCIADYDWWTEQLVDTEGPGTFGENLTLSGIASSDVHVGDRFQGREVLLEVTSPRIPCNTLAARMGDPGFVKRFHAANRPGFYCRVLSAGTVAAGETLDYLPYAGERVSISEMMRTYPYRKLDLATAARYLAVPAHRKLAQELHKLYG